VRVGVFVGLGESAGVADAHGGTGGGDVKVGVILVGGLLVLAGFGAMLRVRTD
jgi:hypothetical protein